MTMKKCVKNIICLFALLGAGLTVSAQNITISFYAPTATMTTNFTGATAAYLNAEDACGGNATGYSYVVLDNQTAPIFRTMTAGTNIRKTYDSLTTPASKMRTRLMQIRGLSNAVVNDIEIHLF